MSILDETWGALLEAAPELSQAPWLAMPVAQSGIDPVRAGQVAAHGANTVVRQKAVKRLKDHHGHGLFGSIVDSVVRLGKSAWGAEKSFAHGGRESVSPEQVAKDAAAKGQDPQTYYENEVKSGRILPPGLATQHALSGFVVTPEGLSKSLNAPLEEVQHQYRYLHDVQQRHGTAAMLGELGPITAGAVGGALVGGPQGAVIGGELAGGVEGRLTFTDSWDRTTSQSYRDSSGRPVNPGEDVARVTGKVWPGEIRRGTAPYKALADISGAAFVYSLDPIQAGAGVLHGPGGKVGALAPDRTLIHASDVDRLLAQSRSARKVFEDMASKPAEQIVSDYPEFAPLAKDLGAARTTDGVAQVLKDAFDQAEVVGLSVPQFVSLSRPQELGALASTASEDARIGRVARSERMARTKLPMILDPETLALSNREIDPVHNTAEAFDAVERLAKFGKLSDRAAAGVKEDYINTQSSAKRITILRNLTVRSVLSKLPKDVLEDPNVESEIRQAVTDNMGGISGGIDDVYGHNTMGLPTSKVTLADGSESSAGIWLNQRGPIALPDYALAQRWAREEAGPMMKYFGRIDDFTYSHLVVPFKRLALLTGGFALRVGTAEGIPAALRNGFYNTMRASIGTKAASLGYKLEEEEAGHITAAMEKLVGGADRLLNSEADRDLAAEIAMRTQGHMVSPAINPGHFASTDRIGKAESETLNIFKAGQNSPRAYEADQFMGFGQSHRDFPLYWQRALREAGGDGGAQGIANAYRNAFARATNDGKTLGEAIKSATDAAVATDREFLGNLPAQVQDAYQRAHLDVEDSLTDWAKTRVETFKGLTHTPDYERLKWLNETQVGSQVGTMPAESARPMMELIGPLSAGEAPPLDVLKNIATNERPLQVKGRVQVPDMSGNFTERLANWGHAKVLSPVINTLGREHQFFIAVKEAYEPYAKEVAAGLMDHDTAMGDAMLKATRKTLKFIHNPAERTQMAVGVRTVAPFYFAQEQAYRRVGRLIKDDPQAFVRYMRAIMAVRNYTHEVQDRTGTAQVMLPGLGFIDEGFVKAAAALHLPIAGTVPIAMLGNVNSLNTILPFSEDNPFRPNWSPIVTYPAHLLMDFDPEARRWITPAIGESAASGQSYQVIIPNTALRNLVNAIRPDAERGATYQSSMISVIQGLAYQQKRAMGVWVKAGHSPDDPGHPQIIPDDVANNHKARQKFISRVKNQVRVMLIVKALVSAGSPLAPSLSIGYPELSAEYQRYIKPKSEGGLGLGVVEGTQKFLEDNPDATPYTIAKSDFPQGAPLPPYAAAQDFYDNNKDLFHNYPEAAAYFLPQDATGKYDPAVYNEQLALGLRERKDAGKWVEDFFIAEGNHQFYDVDYPAYQEDLANAKTKADKSALRDSWSSYLQDQLAVQNPTWWKYLNDPERENDRVDAIRQIRRVFAADHAPHGQMADDIASLLEDYDGFLDDKEAGQARHWSANQRDALTDSWKAYLDSVVKDKPQMGMIVNRLFRPLATQSIRQQRAA